MAKIDDMRTRHREMVPGPYDWDFDGRLIAGNTVIVHRGSDVPGAREFLQHSHDDMGDLLRRVDEAASAIESVSAEDIPQHVREELLGITQLLKK